MTLGLSVFLVVAGATLRYALTWRVVGVDLPVLGLILMVAGIVTSVICVLRAVVPLPTRASTRERDADLRARLADADGQGQGQSGGRPPRRTIPLADGRRGGTARPGSVDSLTVPGAPGAVPFPVADTDAHEFGEPYPDLAQRPYLTLEQHVFGGRAEAGPAEPRDEAGI
jgi:hypothetical protein